MSTGIVVRPFQPADVAEILPFERASFGSYAFEAERLIHWASLPRAVALCATEADRVVGYTIILCGRDEAHVISLAVDPACRRRGVGRALFRAALQSVARFESQRIRADVRSEDGVAQQFWRSLGFDGTDVAADFYPDGQAAVMLACAVDTVEKVTE